MQPSNMAYDRAITVFSPDGRLFQVEYARESIKKGTTTLGCKFKDGVLLLNYKNKISNLIEINSTDKIFPINNEIFCSFVGLSADARHILNYALEVAANHMIWFDEKIMVRDLVEEISKYKHLFTTYYGLRPFGLVLIIAGIDSKGVHLYGTDPSGAFLEYKAICEGQKNNSIIKYLDKHYKDDLKRDAAIDLVVETIKASYGKKINADRLELGFIEKNKAYYKVSIEEINKIL